MNERWPSYWAALFDAEGYELFEHTEATGLVRPTCGMVGTRRIASFSCAVAVMTLGKSPEPLLRGKTGPTRWNLVHPRCFETFRRSLEVQNTALVTAQEKITAYELRITQAEAQADRADAHATEMAAQADRAIAQAAAANAQLAAVLRSTSWRIMGPMRWVFAPMWRTARSVVRTFSRPPRTNLARRSHER